MIKEHPQSRPQPIHRDDDGLLQAAAALVDAPYARTPEWVTPVSEPAAGAFVTETMADDYPTAELLRREAERTGGAPTEASGLPRDPAPPSRPEGTR